MPEPATLKRRFLGLCATSLTALCLPVLDFQLNQSRTMHARDNYVLYLAFLAVFSILWPLSTARSLARLSLQTAWILAVVLPYSLASLAVAALILAGLWSTASSLTTIASLAIQIVLIPLYLIPRKPSASGSTPGGLPA